MATTKKTIERAAKKAGKGALHEIEKEIVTVERKLGWKLSAVIVGLLVLAGYIGWLAHDVI